MRATYVVASLALAGAIALTVPALAQDRTYPDGAPPGAYGMDVAPGGGVYRSPDVAVEAPGRMSHPVAGERRAPSQVAQGSLAHVDAVENAETARLNQSQLEE